MFVKQLYTNCLSEAAYYIESDGEAAIIDPIRDTDEYIKLASERKTKIKYILETHFHADFVSGHIDLAEQTGASIVYGPGADPGYRVYHAADGEDLKVGKVSLRVLHTPGHTLESSCYLLSDEAGTPYALFTGDTLFVGDVGRPDLLDKNIKSTKEEMAEMLFESLQKIKSFPDEVIVYPAHGPGSACGKNIGKETWSTIGIQKKTNYALQFSSREEFVKNLTQGLLSPPGYFFEDARINKNGYDKLAAVMKKNMRALSVKDFCDKKKSGAMILDTRIPDVFEKGFVPESLNIGLNGTFAVWAGTLVDIKTPLILVSEPGKEEESVLRLARVGYECVSGYLEGGIKSWIEAGNPVDTISSVDAGQFCALINQPGKNILDVRKLSEAEAGHVKGAFNLPLSELSHQIEQLDKNKEYMVYCAGGYRSMIACSILRARGFKNLTNVYGGFGKIKDSAAPLVQGVPGNFICS